MAAPFIESPRFPDEIAFSASVGPRFRTDVAEGATGFQQRNAVQPAPLYQWDIASALREMDNVTALTYGLRAVRDYFNAAKGRAYGFRIKNFFDYSDEGAGILGTGNGVLTAFQMLRRYTVGGLSTDKPIQKPIAATIAVYINAVLQSSGYTLNSTTGVVTFSSPPAGGTALTWTGQYDLPGHFDSDEFRARPESGGLYQIERLRVLEYRVAP